MSLNWDSILDDQDTNAEDFAVIPASTYPIRVDNVEVRVAQSGNNMLNVTCRIEGGPYNNRLLWTNIVFATDNTVAMKFTLRKLRALGVTREWIATNNPSVEQIAAKLIGATAEAEVEVRQWNDEDRNDIKSFRRTDGDSPASEVAPSAPKSAAPKAPKAPSATKPSGTKPSVPTAPPVPVLPEPEDAEDDGTEEDGEEEPF